MATSSLLAHDVLSASVSRTDDVKLQSEWADKTFRDLHLPAALLEGLSRAGFVRPSPIQMKAIPAARLGLDLIVQSKSGTGKTLVYVVGALCGLDADNGGEGDTDEEAADKKDGGVRALVLAPTREIAVQGVRAAMDVSSGMKGVRSHALIGGMSVKDDVDKLKRCVLAVGTPGRVKQLIEEKHLKTDAIRLFALDEADKLMESSFADDITWIFNQLPATKQVMALSATYPEELARAIERYMKNPVHVRLGKDDQVLQGIAQFTQKVAHNPSPPRQRAVKAKALFSLLNTVSFSQCLVFCNHVLTAQALCQEALNKGWPAEVMASAQDQRSRLRSMQSLKQFQIRVLFSTDLAARGIDAQNVDLVVNVDVPWDPETYLHRIGRGGRFGTLALAVTLAAEGEEYDRLRKIVYSTGSSIRQLPEEKDLPQDFDLWESTEIEMSTVEALEYKEPKRDDEEGQTSEGRSLRTKKRGKRAGKRRGGRGEEEDEESDQTLYGSREAENEEFVDITKAWVPVVPEKKKSGGDLVDITKAWVPVETETKKTGGRADIGRTRQALETLMSTVKRAAETQRGKYRRNMTSAQIDKLSKKSAEEIAAELSDSDNYEETKELALSEENRSAAAAFLEWRDAEFGSKLDGIRRNMKGMSLKEALMHVRDGKEASVTFERRLPASGERNKKMAIVGSLGEGGHDLEAEEQEQVEAPQVRRRPKKTATTVSGGNGSKTAAAVEVKYVLPHPDPHSCIPQKAADIVSDPTWFEEWSARVAANAEFVRDVTLWQTMNRLQQQED